MDKIVTRFVIIALLSSALTGPLSAASVSPVNGGKLPVINLPVPKDSHQKDYLGLSGDGFFKVHEIKAKGILIKIFNLYCPICQSTASAMAEIYGQIENNPDLKDKIKLMGIGAGNTVSEVELFRQTYNIPFPIFSDEDFRIHHLLGEVKTPFFIAIKMGRDGSQEIVHTHSGGFTDAQAFLDLMVEAYGIKQEDLFTKKAASSPKDPRSDVE